MLDRSEFWTPATLNPAPLSGPGLSIALLPAMPQVMVSGDLEGFLARHDLPAASGLWQQTSGQAYALRLARNRMLVVGREIAAEDQGWHHGAAVTAMTGALAVIEIKGSAIPDLIARATAVDPRQPSPAAALQFAGVTLALASHGEALRLHVDRGLTAYLFDWFKATGLLH